MGKRKKSRSRSPKIETKRSRKDLEKEISLLKEKLGGRHFPSHSGDRSRHRSHTYNGPRTGSSRRGYSAGSSGRLNSESRSSSRQSRRSRSRSRNVSHRRPLAQARSPHGTADSHVSDQSRQTRYRYSSRSQSRDVSPKRPPAQVRSPRGTADSPVSIQIEEQSVLDTDSEDSDRDGKQTTVVEEDKKEEILDENILHILGEDKENTEVFELHTILKSRWKTILSEGLKKDKRAELMLKYNFPTNLVELGAPELNAEFLSALPDSVIQKDKFEIARQAQLGKALAALGKSLNVLLNNNSLDKQDILAPLSDSARILSDLHFRMSMSRRAVLAPHFKQNIKGITTTLPVGQLLYGNNLSESIKAAKALEQASRDLRSQYNNVPRKQYNQERFKKTLNSRGLPGHQRRNPRQQRPIPQQRQRRPSRY